MFIIKNQINANFIILWLACIFGSYAVLPYLVSLSGKELTLTRMLAYFMQNAIIYAIACAGGLYFSREVGFRLILDQKNKQTQIKKFLMPAILYGLFVGLTILFFESTFFKMSLSLIKPPWYLGLLASFYGAINEEVISRLFLLSFIIWGLQKVTKSESTLLNWLGIVAVALLFGMGHLPVAFQAMAVNYWMLFRILLGNGIAGVVFGYLFIQYSLEAAMLAHFIADLLLHVMN